MSQLAKDSAITIVSRIIFIALAFLTNIIVARQLGPTRQGTYQVVILILNTTNMFFLFGLGSANIFLGARQPAQLPFMVGNSLMAAFVLGVLALALTEGFLFWAPVQGYMTENGVPMALMRSVLWTLPVLLLWSFLREIIHATGRITLYNLLSLLQALIQLSLVIALFTIRQDKLQSAVYAWITSYVALTVPTVYLALKAVDFQIGLNWPVFKQSLSFGLRNHVAVVTQFLNYRLDIFLIGIFLAPAFIGFYGIATLYAERVGEIPSSIRTALMYHAANDEASAATITARVTRVISSLVGLFSVFMIFVSYPFIYFVYGEAYLPVVPALILLLPGVWALSIGKLLAVYLASENRPEIGAYTSLAVLIVTVVLDIVLIPTMGIAGAAIASSISYGVFSIIIAYVFMQMSHLPLKEILIIQRQDLMYLARMLTIMKRRIAVGFQSRGQL